AGESARSAPAPAGRGRGRLLRRKTRALTRGNLPRDHGGRNRMRFPGLVENEILKISKQRRFRVVVLILVALIGLIVFAHSRGRERFRSGRDWRVQTQERMAQIQNWLRDGRMPAASQRWARFELGRLQYHLERNMDPEAISGPLFARGFANAASYLLLPLLAI